MGKRLSIYVSSPDSYSDVFEVFLKGYRNYWRDCPYEFILTTNSRSYEGLTCICNHKQNDTWIERTIDAMPLIRTKYILLMCDDLIIRGNVDNNEIESILDYMDAYNMRFCRLNPLPSKIIVKDLPYLSRVNRQTPYAINLQIGIFRKDYLLQLLGTGELSAWDIENQLITETARAKNELFPDVVSVNRFVIPFVHGVIKGKWIRKSLSYVKKQYPEIKIYRDVIPLTMEIKIDLIDALQHVLSQKTRKRLKSFLRSLGVKFTTKE